MSDDWLRAELEALESSAPTAPPQERRSSSRWLVLAIAGAVAGFAIVGGFVVAGLTRPIVGEPTAPLEGSGVATRSLSPSEVSASPSPTLASPSAMPSASGPLVWELVSVPAEFVAITQREETWTALTRTQAWKSRDLSNWIRGSLELVYRAVDSCEGNCGDFKGFRPIPTALTILRSEIYAIGFWQGSGDDLHTVAWRARDGAAFKDLATDWAGYFVHDVASNGSMLVATQHDYQAGSGSVWSSTDAITWSEHTTSNGRAGMTAVWGDADGFVAVGYRGGDDEGTPLPIVWRSPDGVVWSESAIPGEGYYPVDVSRDSFGRYYAVGLTRLLGGETSVLVWSSGDGVTWSAPTELGSATVPWPAFFDPSSARVMSANGEVIVLASDAGEIATWTSRDEGESWTDSGSLVIQGIDVGISDVLTDGTRIVVSVVRVPDGEPAGDQANGYLWVRHHQP